LNFGLAGQTAIVGGASAGLGLAIAESLRQEDANVVMFSNEPDELKVHASRMGGVAVAGDQRVEADLRRLVEVTVDTFGRADILILNGGGPSDGPAVEMDEKAVQAGLVLMLLPVIRLTRLALPYLRQSPQGRIVAVTSTSVLEPIDNLAQSNTFRPAILGWLKTLAREVGQSDVTVNAIAPGRIATRTLEEFYRDRPIDEDLAGIPLGRFGEPREVGDLVCFLASERAAYISGALIPIDGGMTHSLV
jgi:3-oxoacyl-[acyl-carrier protein] reductase